MQIKEMEAALGGALLERSARQITLTRLGEELTLHTLQFLEELGRPFLQKPFKLDALRRVLAGVVKVPA